MDQPSATTTPTARTHSDLTLANARTDTEEMENLARVSIE